jgi:hypothetical protein
MSAKISAELSRRLKEVGEASAEDELPVIVTIKKDSDLAALKKKGLKIQHAYENIDAVSGTLPAAAVSSVAKLDEVQLIDFDGEVHALKNEEGEE